MPSTPQSRDRYRGHDSDRDRERDRRDHTRRKHRYEEDAGLSAGVDADEEQQRRRRERVVRDKSRGGYDSHGYYEVDVEVDNEDDDEDDGRRGVGGYNDRYARRDARRLTPADDDRRRAPPPSPPRAAKPKAKESPATSPIKKRDRVRDREGHRRYRSYDENEDGEGYGSPTTRKVRERRHHTREDDRERRIRHSEDIDAQMRRERRREREREREAADTSHKHQSTDSTNSGTHLLSADALAKLSSHLDKNDRREREQAEKQTKAERKRQRYQAARQDDIVDSPRRDRKGRVVSGPLMEEGRSPRIRTKTRTRARGDDAGEYAADGRWQDKDEWDENASDEDAHEPFWKRKKTWRWIGVGGTILLLAILIPVAVVASKRHSSSGTGSGSHSGSNDPMTSNLNGLNPNSIPPGARGTVLDPWTWYQTIGFNVTYTPETVGGLSVMGLNSTWDDSARPNVNVPPLNQPFPYGKQPIRGVNLGGWLSIEPFITPSLFSGFAPIRGVVDEWTLCQQLGPQANKTLEQHYATFITEQDFADIRDAGLDHVRIQYSYWAITTYEGDPYVAQISWRYLLRAIEWCRKYGLRVMLDFHGIPGSQNGWNHSGRQGSIGWMNGTDGATNRQRSLDNHKQLSQFFAQPRYKNVVTIYGLVNEPLMLKLPIKDVLDWTTEATSIVQKNGITAFIAFHDGFLNLNKWDQMLTNGPANHMMLDTHQYTIFNAGEIVLDHAAKIDLVCKGWKDMIQAVNGTGTGWGPTVCGEWSQADTDCAQYLNNVGTGTRWEGTLNISDPTQYCPTGAAHTCKCDKANADPSSYSAEYKTWLQTYAEAQMSAFEQGMGWFYWTWATESAAQWSYRTAWQNGFMPSKAYAPAFKCGDTVPNFGSLPEYY